MSTTGHRPFRTTPASPPVLRLAVVEARASLAWEREQAPSSPAPEARAALLEALEAYVASLEEARLPVPYAMRDEVRIRRLAEPGDGIRRLPRAAGPPAPSFPGGRRR